MVIKFDMTGYTLSYLGKIELEGELILMGLFSSTVGRRSTAPRLYTHHFLWDRPLVEDKS